MYVDYDPNESKMGVNFDLGERGNVDFNYYLDKDTMGAINWDMIGNIAKNIPFDKLVNLFKKRKAAAAPAEALWMGMKPATVIIGGSAVAVVGGILTAVALKKKKK